MKTLKERLYEVQNNTEMVTPPEKIMTPLEKLKEDNQNRRDDIENKNETLSFKKNTRGLLMQQYVNPYLKGYTKAAIGSLIR